MCWFRFSEKWYQDGIKCGRDLLGKMPIKNQNKNSRDRERQPSETDAGKK
jgi:hypothetical protein